MERRPSLASARPDDLAMRSIVAEHQVTVSRWRDNAWMRRMRLSCPELDFWVDVSVFNKEHRWLAIAMIGGEPEMGTGTSAFEATRIALAELGPEASHSLLRVVFPSA